MYRLRYVPGKYEGLLKVLCAYAMYIVLRT